MKHYTLSVFCPHSLEKLEPGPETPQGLYETTEEAVIPNVSVLTEGPAVSHTITLGEGPNAKEYQIFVDAQTIAGVISAAGEYANGVKVKANHRSGVEAVFGRLTDFKEGVTKEGKKCVRASLHLFKTSPLFSHLLNLVKTIPDAIGLSAYFDGPLQRIGDQFFMRCKELFSVDLVSDPSANPSGVFEIKVDNPQQDQGAHDMTPEDITKACEAAIKPHIDGLSTRLAKLEAGHSMIQKHLKLGDDGKPAPDDAAPAPVDEEAMYSRLLARVIADPKVKEIVTVELQNTAKTLTALGLTPGTGPLPSLERQVNQPSLTDPAKMNFLQLLEAAYADPANKHKRDFEIVTELARQYPAKHLEQRNKRDADGKFTGLAILPKRAVPYEPKAA